MNINHAVALNLAADSPPPRLHMVQGDSNSRTIVATLWNGSQPYTVPSGTSIMMRFRKPDGTGGLYDTTEGGSAISVSGNTATVPVATQLLAAAGAVAAELDIYGTGTGAGAERLATFRFIIEVAANVYPDAEIISSDYYNVLTADIAAATAAAAQAKASADAAANSAAGAAASVTGAVKYNSSQDLTAAQKQQAQENIGAADAEGVSTALSEKQDTLTAGDGIAISSANVISARVYPCNPNLLDNWYFGNPVNQRGKTTYSGAGGTADRWFARSSRCYATVGSGVLKLEESGTGDKVYYQQKLEFGVTEVATLTVLTGTVVGSCSAYIMTAAGTDPGIGMTLKANTANVLTISTKDIGAIGFGVPDGGRIDLKAVKLELGTEQTLAHQDADGNWVLNAIPDYAEVLWKCQRYLQLYTTSAARPAKALDCRPVMSSDPVQSALTIDGTTYYANSVGM